MIRVWEPRAKRADTSPYESVRPLDPRLCHAEVHSGAMRHQCRRKPGSGPDGKFCPQHARMTRPR